MAHPGGRMTEEDEAFEDLAKRQDYWGMQGSRKHQILRFTENVESKVTSMTDKEALKKMYQLLLTEPHAPTVCAKLEAIAREALAQPEQEPVADDIASIIAARDMLDAQPVPPRTWVGLTDEEMSDIVADIDVDLGDLLWKVVCLTKIIEATLKERNT